MLVITIALRRRIADVCAVVLRRSSSASGVQALFGAACSDTGGRGGNPRLVVRQGWWADQQVASVVYGSLLRAGSRSG